LFGQFRVEPRVRVSDPVLDPDLSSAHRRHLPLETSPIRQRALAAGHELQSTLELSSATPFSFPSLSKPFLTPMRLFKCNWDEQIIKTWSSSGYENSVLPMGRLKPPFLTCKLPQAFFSFHAAATAPGFDMRFEHAARQSDLPRVPHLGWGPILMRLASRRFTP
jgi:hypothetical protein